MDSTPLFLDLPQLLPRSLSPPQLFELSLLSQLSDMPNPQSLLIMPLQSPTPVTPTPVTPMPQPSLMERLMELDTHTFIKLR
jgi:hypothetical protein